METKVSLPGINQTPKISYYAAQGCKNPWL